VPGLVIQLRDKDSDKKTVLEAAVILRKELSRTKSIFIVNDHADIAKLADADGLHLGQSDLPLKYARRLLGSGKLIGISCSNLKEALAARENGADYLGIGPVFPTDTKAECGLVDLKFVKAVAKKISIPVFAIGGINEINIKEVLSLGCRRVAISSAICTAPDPVLATRRFSNILNS
jgi:thiamine-phosphate pyrophosphorylase